ncbi:MAG: nickel-dependent lactate racemase [Firmicutes bacterium]|nr:nickel-dependent lactate racemase [Bacillota bacterium]
MVSREFTLEYGEKIYNFSLPAENCMGYVQPMYIPGAPDPKRAVTEAIRNPIGSPPLREIVRRGEKVAIICSNSGRPWVDNTILIPPILDELNSVGIPDEDIYIVLANGTMLPESEDSKKRIMGEEVYRRVKIYNHECQDRDSMVYLGRTNRGTEVYVNKLVMEADRRILTGGITFHENVGFGGGRKAILPGVSFVKTIEQNHYWMLDPVPGYGLNIKSVAGKLDGNPCHEDMVEIAAFARPDFMVNSVVNRNNEVIQIFAGHFVKAWLEGVRLANVAHSVTMDQPADLTVTTAGTYHHQMVLPNAFKRLLAGVEATRDGGVVVMLCGCWPLGQYPQVHLDTFKHKTFREMDLALRKNFSIGGYTGFLLAHMTLTRHIIFVGDEVDERVLSQLHIQTVSSLDEALNMAYKIVGPAPRSAVLPCPELTHPVTPDGNRLYYATRHELGLYC